MLITGILIAMGRMIDVSLGTMKLKAVIRGNKVNAFLIAFIEVIVYTLAASQAFKYVNDPTVLILYALGYAGGNFLGIAIDEKLSKGTFMMMIITNHDGWILADTLRDLGYGVTTTKSYGMNGAHKSQLTVIVDKTRLKTLVKTVKEYDENAYMVNLDVKDVRQASSVRK